RLRTVRKRALAALEYGDAASWLDRGRAHAARNEWNSAAAAYARALDLLPDEFWKYSQVIPLCADMGQSPQVFTRLVALRPHDTRPWMARGDRHVEAGDIRGAAADFARACELAPDDLQLAYTYAVLRLASDDRAGCRKMWCDLLTRHAGSKD